MEWILSIISILATISIGLLQLSSSERRKQLLLQLKEAGLWLGKKHTVCFDEHPIVSFSVGDILTWTGIGLLRFSQILFAMMFVSAVCWGMLQGYSFAKIFAMCSYLVANIYAFRYIITLVDPKMASTTQ